MTPQRYLAHLINYRLLGRGYLAWQRVRDEQKLRALRPAAGDPLSPPLVRTARMKELMSRHYLEGRYANGVRKVAWVTSGAPIEILRALDFFLIYPENHAALCGARRQAEALSIEAENAGYSRDICSYARTDIGAAISGKTPMGRLPRPDLLLCCNNICQTVLYWYRVLAAHFDVPLYVIDTPFLYEQAEQHQLDFVREQIEGLIPVAEKVAGRRMSVARLQEIVNAGKECSELWLQILDRAQHRPSPITAFDGFINMGPIVDLRGEPETLAFYRALLEEIDRRIDRGVGAIREERLRVLWDNLPVWYKIGKLSKHLGRSGVNVVVSTYTYAWGELAPMMDASDPLTASAKVYLHPILNRSTGDKLAHMRRLVDAFQLNGAILHSDRSCKPYSLGQIDQRDRLAAEIGVPALLLDADHNDPRAYSDEQVDARLDAFIETMEAA